MEVAAGFDEAVGGGGGGGLGGDGEEFGVAEGLVGQVGGFTAVVGVVGAVVEQCAEGEVRLDVFLGLLDGYLGVFADVVHGVSCGYGYALWARGDIRIP